MEEFIVSVPQNIAFFPNHAAAVSMEGEPGTKPTTGKVKEGTSTGGAKIKVAKWGDDNDFTGMIKKALVSDPEMQSLIDWKVRASVSLGLAVLQETDYDDDGNPMYKAIKDREILSWFQSRMVKRYIHEAFIDTYTFFNVFPELIPTRDRSRIHGIYLNEAMHCRWEQMGDDGRLSNIIHNKNWPNAKLEDPKETTLIPAIDPYDFDLVTKVRADKSLKKFIFPCSYPTIGQTYYQLAHWDGLRVSGWLEIAAKIPEFKKALLLNQMTIKYLIRIPNTYWPSKYKDWDKKNPADQTAAKKETMKEINEHLTDVKNTGKSILNEVGFDPITKEKLPGWEIVVIDDKTKPGAFNEDSQEASSFKMRALSLDNSLVGNLMTGKGMGAGSGSDKRLAFNIHMALLQPYRDIVLEPLMFAAEFNGWADKYPGFTLRFRDVLMQTLDVAHETSKEGVTYAS